MSELKLQNIQEDKQTAILDAAIALFARNGFQGTDVQLIADRAGVGKGTVYRRFGNKTDLFWATTMEVVIRLEDAISEEIAHCTTELDRLKTVAIGWARFFAEHLDHLEIFVQQQAEFHYLTPEHHREHHEKSHEQFIEIFRRGVESGEFRADLDLEKTMIAFTGLLFGAVSHSCWHLCEPGTDGLTQNSDKVVDCVMQGVGLFLDGMIAVDRKGEQG
jgi:AcrR family transcriptional regulator